MSQPSRAASWGIAALFLLSMALLGFALGGLVATRIFTTSGMGWDQIADAIGGAFVGIVIALIIGAIAVRRISARGRLIGTGAALLVTALALVYLQNTPAKVNPPGDRVVIPPLVEPFSLQLGTTDPLEGPRRSTEALPWKNLRINSNLSFDYVAIDAPNTLCVAAGALADDEGIAALKALREIVASLPTTIDCPPCPTCTHVDLVWYLDQERSTLSTHERCWRENEALQPLRRSIEGIVAGHAGDVSCETNN